jgi:hypothetical protein
MGVDTLLGGVGGAGGSAGVAVSGGSTASGGDSGMRLTNGDFLLRTLCPGGSLSLTTLTARSAILRCVCCPMGSG